MEQWPLGHAQLGTSPKAGPLSCPVSFCGLGKVWGLSAAGAGSQGAADAEQHSSVHACCPLGLLGTSSAAVICSVIARKESALTQVQEAVGLDSFPPRSSVCGRILLQSPETEAPLSPGSSRLSQHPPRVTLSSSHCSHRQSTDASSCSGKPCHHTPAGSQEGYKVL